MEDSRNDLEGRIGSLDVRGDAATAAAAADGGVGTVKGAAKAAGEDAVNYSDRVLDQTRGAYLKAKRVVAKTKALERRSALDAHEVRVLEAATEAHEKEAREHAQNARVSEAEVNKVRSQMRVALRATRRTVAFNAIASHAIAHDAALVARVVHEVLHLRRRADNLLKNTAYDANKVHVDHVTADKSMSKAAAYARTAKRWLHAAMHSAVKAGHSAEAAGHAAWRAGQHNAAAAHAAGSAVEEARRADRAFAASAAWFHRERELGYGEAGPMPPAPPRRGWDTEGTAYGLPRGQYGAAEGALGPLTGRGAGYGGYGNYGGYGGYGGRGYQESYGGYEGAGESDGYSGFGAATPGVPQSGLGEGYQRRSGSALKDSKEVVDDVVALMEHLTHQLQAAGSDCGRVQEELTHYQHAMARFHAEGVGLGNLLSDDDMELVKEYAEAQVQSFASDLQESMAHAEAFCGLSEGAFLSPDSYSTYAPDYAPPAGEARWGGEQYAARGPLEAPALGGQQGEGGIAATVNGVKVTSAAGRTVDVRAPPGQRVASINGRPFMRIPVVPAGMQAEPMGGQYPALAQRPAPAGPDVVGAAEWAAGATGAREEPWARGAPRRE